MKEKHARAARALRQKLDMMVTVLDLRVFGSCARDDDVEGSDLDIFVEIETLTREAKELIRNAAWETSLEHNEVISPLIFSRDEIERSPLRASPIVAEIYEHGIRV